MGRLPLSPKSYGKPIEIKKEIKPTLKCKKTIFQQWGPLDEKNVEIDVSSWLYHEEDELLVDIPTELYPKASMIIDKWQYEGHGLGPKGKGTKQPINLVSYKHNQGLGYAHIPKLIIPGPNLDSLLDVDDSDEEEYHEMPFEYLDNIFDTNVNAIISEIPYETPLLIELNLVHLDLIDWDQQGTPMLDICNDDKTLYALLTTNNIEHCSRICGIQLIEQGYFGSQINTLSHQKENQEIHDSGSENLPKALSNEEKVKTKDVFSDENLQKVSEEGDLYLPTLWLAHHEAFSHSIEETDTISLGSQEEIKNVLIAQSLTEQE